MPDDRFLSLSQYSGVSVAITSRESSVRARFADEGESLSTVSWIGVPFPLSG